MNPLTLVKRIQSINSKEADLGISEEASWHTKYKDSAYIFIGGIPFDLTEGDLLAVFAQYGEIVDVNLIRDKGTGKSKGFAFLAYEDQRSTILAVDNLNGAQILGRIVRVDHCSNYKKKEEEDEETERQKREARGVCRAFQRGECTRGAACKFSHDEQRAANTGWGAEDKSSRWGHDKFDGKKSERRFGNQEGFRSGDKDLSSRARSNERLLQSHPKESDGKRLRRHEDDETEQQSREDHGGRQENRMKRYDEDFELKSRDNRERREEKRSTRYINDDESKLRDDSIRREERRTKQNDNDSDYRREERRFGRYNAGEYESRSGQDHYRREEKKLRRHGDDEFEPRSREEHERREGKGSRKHEPESSLRADRDGGACDGNSSSHRHGDRDDHHHRRAR